MKLKIILELKECNESRIAVGYTGIIDLAEMLDN